MANVIEVDDDENDTSAELVKPKRCKSGESAQSQNQGRGCRQPTQQSDKSVMSSKVQEIKDEPEDSGNDMVKVENGKEKKKGGRKKQAVIEIEKGSTKLLVKMPFNKNSSSISDDQENGNKK